MRPLMRLGFMLATAVLFSLSVSPVNNLRRRRTARRRPAWSRGIRATGMPMMFKAAITARCKAAQPLLRARSGKRSVSTAAVGCQSQTLPTYTSPASSRWMRGSIRWVSAAFRWSSASLAAPTIVVMSCTYSPTAACALMLAATARRSTHWSPAQASSPQALGRKWPRPSMLVIGRFTWTALWLLPKRSLW